MKWISILVSTLTLASIVAASPISEADPEAQGGSNGLLDPRASTAAADCYWDGTAPFCIQPSDERCTRPGYVERGYSHAGDGKACMVGYKVRCCKVPPPSPDTADADGDSYE